MSFVIYRGHIQSIIEWLHGETIARPSFQANHPTHMLQMALIVKLLHKTRGKSEIRITLISDDPSSRL